ncbi:MAG: hypothetical protein OXQ29_11905 [Rhodospirillaceae bacterium]|nr:hypothetical protein [Rhodospirillaceae bacterium]
MATRHAEITANDEGVAFADYAVLWGVVDGHRTYFDRETDFGPAQNQPVLYGHGGDETLRASVLGVVTERTVDDVGLWVASQINKAAQYYENVKRLIDAGAVGWSVGSMPGGYVEEPVGPKGVKRVASFLLAEMTLTPMPSQARLAQGMLERSIADYDPTVHLWRLDHEITARECRLMEMHLSRMLRHRE